MNNPFSKKPWTPEQLRGWQQVRARGKRAFRHRLGLIIAGSSYLSGYIASSHTSASLSLSSILMIIVIMPLLCLASGYIGAELLWNYLDSTYQDQLVDGEQPLEDEETADQERQQQEGE